MIKVIWPERINLNYWAACLVADYPSENLPKLEDEESWQSWAAVVASTGIFAKAGVPSPISTKEGVKRELFKEWDKWAKAVYNIMSDDYNVPKISTL